MLDILTFNERVVREALLNAVSHRNYQAYGSVFVRQYNDRLVIESPGGLPAGVSVKNILDKQVPRNRRIAEMFQKCGLVERSGQGMNLMFELSVREAKALPDFTGTDDNSVRITLNGLVLDQRMLTAIKRIGDERLELLSTVDFVIINYLFREAEFPADLLGRIKNLVDMGIVEHTGRRKYVLARRLYESVGKAGVHTRLVGLNQGQNKALIYNHIASGGSDGTPMSELQQVLPNLSRGQVQLLLRQLRSEGKIKLSGKTRAAKWLKI